MKLTWQEAVDHLKGIYQIDPAQGSQWAETSDIEEAVDLACARGHSYLNDYVITWTADGNSPESGYDFGHLTLERNPGA